MRSWTCALLFVFTAVPVEADFEPPPEAVVGTLPFEEWHEPNRVVVNLAPEGNKPLRMMLDTGAQGSVMTPLMARELGVSVRRNKSTPYRRKTSLGRDLHFWVDTSTSDTGSKTGWEYGLIGGEFLEEFVFEIDFPARRVRFLDPKKYQVPETTDAPGEAVVPLRVTAKRPFVEVEIEGVPMRVLLDTGDPTPGHLSGKAARKAGIDVDSLPSWGKVGFVLGSTEARFYEAASFRLGPFDRSPMPLTVIPRGAFNLGGSNDATIGYDALAPFVIRFDYRRKRMWMRMTGDPRVTLMSADYQLGKTIGAQLVPWKGGWVAWDVTPGSVAGSYGLRAGDQIEPTAVEAPANAEEVVRRVGAGAEMTVTRRQGDLLVDVVLPER